MVSYKLPGAIQKTAFIPLILDLNGKFRFPLTSEESS